MYIENWISSGMEEKLKCAACKNYLSYFPIFLSSKNESFCGRCAIPAGTICFHNEPLEVACESFKFPCRFKSEGCCEELVPKEVPLHEEKCPFREVPCVISKPVVCQWKGNISSLEQHCQTEHSDITLKEGEFQMDLSVSEENDSLLKQETEFYLFTKRFDSDKKLLSCALLNVYNQTTNQTFAFLKVTNGDRSVLLNLKIDEIWKKYSLTDVHLNSLKSGDEDPKLVNGKIEVSDKENPKEKKLEHKEHNSTIVSPFECSNCRKIAMPPIYRNTTVLSIICSSCRSPSLGAACTLYYIHQVDNALTKIAEEIDYSCQNKNQGCTYADKRSKIEIHKITCDFTTVNCAFDKSCTWTSLRKDLPDHINETHQDLIIDCSEIIQLTQNDQNIKYRFLKYWDIMFKLSYVSIDSRFKWSVQIMGHYEDEYKYQIDVFDSTGKELQLSLKMVCSELTEENHIFSNSAKFCYLDWKQIGYLGQPKTQDTNIRFKVKVKK